jgi:hypothetical protein
MLRYDGDRWYFLGRRTKNAYLILGALWGSNVTGIA